MNGVNRLATKGKKYYQQPTKCEKNYRLTTGKILTDYRHGPTLSIFFSERRVYCIFSTFLGSNQRYHVTSLSTNIPQNEGIEIGLQSVWKFLQSNPPSPTHYMREMLGLILVPVQWKALPTNPPYRDGHKDSSFLCQHFHVIYWNTKSKQLNRL